MTTTALVTTPGVYPDMAMAQYHALDAASNSRLSKLRRSPAHLKAYLTEAPESTSALTIGHASHTAILEPDYFDSTFTLAGQCDATKKGDGQRCSNAGVLYRAETGWLCGVHGKGLTSDESRIVLSPDEHRVCLGVRDSVHVHSSAHALLSGPGDVELSMVWEDTESGVLCKGRADRHSPGIAGGTIADIKTTTDARRSAFERSIFSYRYFVQGAHYLRGAAALGIPAEHFVIVAVEKTPPFCCAVYRLTEGVLEAGAEELRALLPRYAECMASGVFSGYSEEVQDIAVPDWSWRQLEQEIAEAVAV